MIILLLIFLCSTGDPNLAAIAQEAAGGTAAPVPILGPDDVPKGLANWRDAVNRCQTTAQLAMGLYTLEASIAWDKSIMKAVSETNVFSKQRALKYNSKLSVGACAFLVPLAVSTRKNLPQLKVESVLDTYAI